MLAGFDTTATTLTNTCFQLARSPDIQEKLHEAIMAKLEDYVNALVSTLMFFFGINLLWCIFL